ncbi:MAG: NAD(+) kinase [Gammaproteobacteria bacterium]|nr:NAD(+) kinase [Gammaproteobacteria bacterium]MCF6363477.1 NAD(+) kinase [Gammaproteobacteria bacterium]
MSTPFKTVGIIGKHGASSASDTVKQLINCLQKQQLEVLLDRDSLDLTQDLGNDITLVDRGELGRRCDLAIVVGGDGTLLNAARELVDHDVPLLGINLGRLGFLTDIPPTDLSTNLSRIFAGEYKEESRNMLNAQVIRNGETVSDSTAFNDVVVHKFNAARMIEYETFIDDQFVNTTRSDGLIVSTPTGSTAYALSSGGPIVHPSLNALVLVPICPHTMSYRPIVVDGNSRVDIIVHDLTHTSARVTCDGQISLALSDGDRVSIQKKPRPIRLIHPPEYNYFSILRAKLHWGKRL